MGRNTTAGTRQLAVAIDAALRDELDNRVEAEDRTLRSVVERALRYYIQTFPVDAAPASTLPEQPKRERSKARGK